MRSPLFSSAFVKYTCSSEVDMLKSPTRYRVALAGKYHRVQKLRSLLMSHCFTCYATQSALPVSTAE